MKFLLGAAVLRYLQTGAGVKSLALLVVCSSVFECGARAGVTLLPSSLVLMVHTKLKGLANAGIALYIIWSISRTLVACSSLKNRFRKKMKAVLNFWRHIEGSLKKSRNSEIFNLPYSSRYDLSCARNTVRTENKTPFSFTCSSYSSETIARIFFFCFLKY